LILLKLDNDPDTHGLRSSAHAARHRAMSISASCHMYRRHAFTTSPGGWFVRSARRPESARQRRCSSLPRARASRRRKTKRKTEIRLPLLPRQRTCGDCIGRSVLCPTTGLMQRNKKRVFAVGTRVTSRPFSGQGGASVSAERRTRQAPQADGSLGNILRAKKAPAPSCKCANENGSWTRIHNPNWEEGPASRRNRPDSDIGRFVAWHHECFAPQQQLLQSTYLFFKAI
jgi:hypothetical protein